MSKFNINQLMNDKSKEKSGKETIAFKIENIPIDKIQPSEMNKYNVDDVEELKVSIELIGLQQNLLVRRHGETGSYEIISGHRRFKAMRELYAAGNESYSTVPCKIIKSTDDIQAELQLILANSTARQLTDYEKTYQAGRLKELLNELKKSGYKFTGRTREIVADFLKVSTSQIGRMESINKNLSPELKEEFKEGKVNITTAYELSKLDNEQQEQALREHQSGVELNPEKAKKHKAKASKKPEQTKPTITIDHELKIYPPEFKAVKSGIKTFEYRLNDRGYKVGDLLRLNEYLPDIQQYTGRSVNVKVTYILEGGSFGLPTGYVAMSIIQYRQEGLL